MKILHVLPTADPAYGGPTTWVYDVSSVLEQMGHEVTVVTADPPEEPHVKNAEIKTIGLGPAKSGFKFTSTIKPWMQQHGNEFDAAFLHCIWEHPLVAAQAGLKNVGIPVLSMTHGMLDPYFNEAHPEKKLKKTIYWKLFLAKALKESTRVLFTCDPERDLAGQSFQPYSVTPRVIKFGCSIEEFPEEEAKQAFLQAIPEVKDKAFILYLGRIDPKKGPDLLIQAFCDVHKDTDVHLVMAGPDGAGMVAGLKETVQKNGLTDRVHFPGMLRGAAKTGSFRLAEVFALPSHQENFGIAVAEALAYHTPVLLTPKVNIYDIIEKSGAAVVNPDTLEGTVQSLQQWKEMPDQERQTMATNARKCYEENFDVQASAADLIKLIEETK